MNSIVSPSCHFGIPHQGLAADRHTWMVGNVKSAFLKDQVIVVSTCGRSITSIPFWLLRKVVFGSQTR